jgi:hypothetical protein
MKAALSAIGLAAVAVRANAQTPMVGMQVINRDTGEIARVWRWNGRLFVAGQPGARYSIRVTNNTPGRVLAVMSVDGVNILTGETAGFGQRGYVFAPYETYDVTGWRKSDSEVAAFTFAPLSRSYAAQTGRPGDVGVIGLAAFSERVYAPPPRPAYVPSVSPEARDESTDVEEVVVTGGARRSELARPAPPPPAARAAPFAPAPQPAEKLGTGHGQREWSSVTTVNFERATSYPQLISRLEYDSTENLIAMGVIPRQPPVPPRPRAFPLNPGGGGYVPDPPYRR